MFYDRKIKYLDYLEAGERQRSAGFVKIEVRGEDCSLTAQVSGLYASDTFDGELLLWDGNREVSLSTLQFRGGKASLQLFHLNSCNLGQTGISYDTLAGIRIPVGIRREISCVWREGMERAKECEESTTSDEVPQAECSQEVCEKIGVYKEAPKLQVSEMKEEHVQESGAELSTAEELSEQRTVYTESKEKPQTLTRFWENKWQQLSAIYPHITPFEDERDYLSVSPADFVVLPEKYYRMVNNSFLLHGYYNYEHLILAKMERRGEVIYYMGVPGNFYDREKQVAVMFGFESFECMEEPARQGDFGYYMMRLEL